MNRVAIITIVAFGLATNLCPALAAQMTALTGTSQVDAKAEVAAVLYAASATQAALAKSIDARLRVQQERIATLAAEIKAGNTLHRAEMSAAQEAFVSELAAKDREYAAQISLFRNAVLDIASTPDGAAALERFNSGDELGAIAILDQLRAANEQMRQARARLEDAAAGRRIAQLALEARTRGKLTTQAVIARFEDVVRLDPGAMTDWLELNRLYRDAGRLTDAKLAVDSLAAAAHTEKDRATAFSERADVLLMQGDLAGSRIAAEQALALSRRMLATDPNDAALQLALARALISFGEIARFQGDFATAYTAYVEEINLARRRLQENLNDTRTRQRLCGDLLHLADVLIARGDLAGARKALEENLSILRQLALENPENIVHPRQIAVSLMWLSDTLVAQGAFEDARKANGEIVAIELRLTAGDPANAILKRDLAYGYSKTSLLYRIEGEFADALRTSEQVLSIFRELAQPSGAPLNAKQDLGTTLTDIGNLKLLMNDVDGAANSAAEGTALLRLHAAKDATDVVTRQFLASALYTFGATLVAKADYAGARKAYDEGLAFDAALLAKNVDSFDIQSDISAGKLGMGRLLRKQGKQNAALPWLQQSLDARRILASQAGNSIAERGVAEVMRELVDVPGSGVDWPMFRKQIQTMQTKGIFWPADRAWIEDASRHSTEEIR